MKVLVLFPGKTDEETYGKITTELEKENVSYALRIASAHKSPKLVHEILKEEYDLIISGAGLSAALPGVIASEKLAPVLGVPCPGAYGSLDAFLSIAQMPPGVPVLAVTAENAAKEAKKIITAMTEKKDKVVVAGEGKPAEKAIKTLQDMNANFETGNPSKDAINIKISQVGEPVPETDDLTICCPSGETKAEDAIKAMEAAKQGLWVGVNRGENAAIAAAQIMRMTEQLKETRKKFEEKCIRQNNEVKKMISEETIKKNMESAIKETNFENLGEKYKGKVRDNYTDKKNGKRIIISTDRISAFDVVLGTIPFKGQILNQMANYWFEETKNVAPSHFISSPDPNVTVVKLCKPFPVEVIIRSYITGSLWREYEKGQNNYGLDMPQNMKKDQKFENPIITPSTKAETGHDMPMKREEVIKLIPEEKYARMEKNGNGPVHARSRNRRPKGTDPSRHQIRIRRNRSRRHHRNRRNPHSRQQQILDKRRLPRAL